MSLRLAFMGTPDFALPTLAAIIEAGHEIVAVYTRPPRHAGRGLSRRRSPVHEFAIERGLRVETPPSLRGGDALQALLSLKIDAAIIVAFGLILPKALLDAPRLGCYNLHASLLPRWRGAAPINRAIMAGDRETGVTIMRMTEGLDEGPICLAARLAIGPGETAGELHDRLARAGAPLMVEALKHLETGTLKETPQAEDGLTYAAKIDKSEAHIDFSQPAARILRHIHALSPFPGAWCALPLGDRLQRLKILKAEAAQGSGAPGEILDDDFAIACGASAVRPLIIQREGKAPLPRAEFLRGLTVTAGMRLE